MKKIILFILLFFILYLFIFIRKEHFKECVYKPVIGMGGLKPSLGIEIKFMKKCLCNEYNIDYFHCNKLLLKHYKDELTKKIYSQINTNFTNKILEKIDGIDINTSSCFEEINNISPHSISILTELNKNIGDISISEDIISFVEKYKFIKKDFQSRFPQQYSEISIPVKPIEDEDEDEEIEYPCYSGFDVKNYISELVNEKFIEKIKFIIDSIDSDEKTDNIEMYDPDILKNKLLQVQINENNMPQISEKITESITKLSNIISRYYCMKSNIDHKNNNCCKQEDCSKKKSSTFFYNRCKEQKNKLKYINFNC